MTPRFGSRGEPPKKGHTFPAAFYGTCPECLDPIQIGEPICRWDSKWAHDQCARALLEKYRADTKRHRSS